MNISKVIEKLNGRQSSILGYEELLKYAVLLPLIEVENETHILFEVRSMSLRRQPGEICFPGGKLEQAESQKQCAIRETSEELGIVESAITDVIPLDFMLNASSNIIYPFVGRVINPERINPNKSEVEEIFTVPLSFFQSTKPKIHKIYFQIVPEEGFPFELITGGENYKWQTRHTNEHFYQYNGKVIWGLTAKILIHFLSLLDND
ncbi:CoA pyrophosphatase [Bacillus sp. V3B]|uniref:NUDIX hydrolase n=1 Tax=Bacillus sp. V3B TaxID=2804915 RepID=UPI00210959A8|nr:CoA pyrophosphatase [Bacillus sp. V3B]MCQ6274152.1 CoA pyrophosphatase [Bacillus sp. V3B]